LIQDFQETAADPTNGRVPKLGMTFLFKEEAYSFYNKYAETIGFSIRRSSGHKMKNSSTMQQRTFTCSRQGIGCIPFFKDGNHIFMHSENYYNL
jgi:zinc finger SWIM domain-containing protein 3